MSATTHASTKPLRLLAEQALSRAAGAPLLGGNTLELPIDAAAHFDAWLKAIGGAQRRVLLDATIARTIITMGREMAMNVIAEGVETAEQRDFREFMAAMPIRAICSAARCRWKSSRSM